MIQILANSRAGILLLIAVLIFSGCATKKRKGDVSKLKKFYHSTTTKYNGHFNANIIYEETLLRLKNANRDNYTQILPLYAEQNADAKAVATELDDAVEKLSTVISIHRVGEWTDDSYYLMGKVQHLKQDYEAAEETLEFFAIKPGMTVVEVLPGGGWYSGSASRPHQRRMRSATTPEIV